MAIGGTPSHHPAIGVALFLEPPISYPYQKGGWNHNHFLTGMILKKFSFRPPTDISQMSGRNLGRKNNKNTRVLPEVSTWVVDHGFRHL